MADSTKNVAYEITGDGASFAKAMEQSAAAALSASRQIDASFKKVGDTFATVQKFAMGWVTVLAGGGALAGIVKDAADWNGQAAKMAGMLGVTTEKASVLNVALARLGIDQDVYAQASQRLSKQIYSNGSAFETMGVQVRDAAGNYRPVTEVMGEVNTKLLEIKNPIEQNIAGQQVYGEGWSEVRGVLKLTAEQMSASEQRARELGLIVGPEGVAAAKKYQSQMRDLNLVGKSLEVQFGQVLLPVFTETGAWLGSEGPVLAQAFGGALKVIIDGAVGVYTALKVIGKTFAGLMAAAGQALTGNFTGAGEALKAMNDDLNDTVDTYDAFRQKLYGGGPAAPAAAPAAQGGPRYNFKPEKEKADKADPSRMGQWEAELEERKLKLAEQARAEGSFREMSKAEELRYWQAIKSAGGLTQTEMIGVRRKIATDGLAIDKADFEARIQSLHLQSEELRANYAERIKLAEQAAQLTAAKYGAESKEAQKAYGEIAALRRQLADQQRTLDAGAAEAHRAKAAADIDLQRLEAQQSEQLGLTTRAQTLQAEATFEEQLYQLRLDALREKLALVDPERDPVAYQQASQQIEAAAQQHEQRMAQIKGQQRAQAEAPELAVFKSAEQALDQNMQALIMRTQTMQQTLTNIYKSIFQTFMQEMVTKPLAQWAMRAVRESAIYKMMGITQVASQESASGAVAGIKASESSEVVASNAAEAGSGAAASQASIPWVGPVLAVAAMAAIFAAVMGMKSSGGGSVKSAAGGFDVGKGENPMTQLHEEEMVLPKVHANTIRALGRVGMVPRGSLPGAAGGADAATVSAGLASKASGTTAAMPAAATDAGTSQPLVFRGTSAGDFFIAHKSEMAKLLKSMKRNFEFQ